ncbi:hypothetical protein NIES4073_76730 [Kalymmatonema gypsitolerans NIES-4073]|nr:hypothetical protein NIES4073_76730 [Scytonema sp. NIES-4073]
MRKGVFIFHYQGWSSNTQAEILATVAANQVCRRGAGTLSFYT